MSNKISFNVFQLALVAILASSSQVYTEVIKTRACIEAINPSRRNLLLDLDYVKDAATGLVAIEKAHYNPSDYKSVLVSKLDAETRVSFFKIEVADAFKQTNKDTTSVVVELSATNRTVISVGDGGGFN